jgi:prefoldin subunit 5
MDNLRISFLENKIEKILSEIENKNKMIEEAKQEIKEELRKENESRDIRFYRDYCHYYK